MLFELPVRDALLATAHHLPLLAMAGLLGAEFVLLARPLDLAAARRLARIDAAYGAAAGLLLLAGVSRIVWGAKPWAFYSGNPVFGAKLAFFAALGLVSIVPTVRFIRWRRAATAPDDAARLSVRRWVHAELALLLPIPLLAALMARGVGH